MERYGLGQEGLQSDPSMEWRGPGAETGLEEPMWRMGLSSGSGGGGDGGQFGYPERPDEADCIYYLRTGFCGYGSRCRFNHPRDRGAYYMRTGTCKFGASCKYHHPRQGAGAVSPVSLNYYGYPMRPGEKECSYYVKTGHCKFGATCKFHHPQPANIQVPAPAQVAPVPTPVPAPAIYHPVQSPSVPSSQQYGVVVARPSVLAGSYVQGPYGPVLLSPGMVPISGWSPYTAPVSPVAIPSTQPMVGSGSMYGVTQLSPSAPAYTGHYQPLPSSAGPSSSSQKEHPFPERPGQPECQYFMKTGDCKFGSSCRYHHPPELSAPRELVVLSPMGLPLRPGAPPCAHYTQRGECKFGPACKFDHPMGTLIYSPSASSLADMPVAPYPVGSSLGTLAPSSSSSELRPELMSGSGKDSSSTRMSSSLSTSSGSVGSVFSASIPYSSMQQSSQSSGPSGHAAGSSSIEGTP
ncbi:zinc finger CCCH domain-containing protein 34-like [Tripterygium wilfordii]|uniref:Zinc finger CCCH domain-containing protein 34-like n=1 Tax=Tripterygium wilfordii TaxID=458696 RepID=A0A7J7CSB7_TRIWF|nr:zinc finger CCCH domain-containing protein 34-like [Tripterygium wilfordii]